MHQSPHKNFLIKKSSENFNLSTNITNSTEFVGELNLCNVYLSNSNDFLWLILVPRLEYSPNLLSKNIEVCNVNKQSHITDLFELNATQHSTLMTELSQSKDILKQTHKQFFSNYPDIENFNYASLGNFTPQVHIHLVARYKCDRAWPHAIWAYEHFNSDYQAQLTKINQKNSKNEQIFKIEEQALLKDFLRKQFNQVFC